MTSETLEIIRKRLIARRVISPSGCWEWQGALSNNGYGKMSIPTNYRSYVHRTAYEVFVGPIPEGLHVCHHCDNRRCFNPAHLFVGTNYDNLDAKAKGRIRNQNTGKTHCIRGHEFTEETTRFILRDGKVQRCCRICFRAHVRAWQLRKKAS